MSRHAASLLAGVLAFAATLALIGLFPARLAGEPGASAAPSSPTQVLQTAFDRTLNYSAVRSVVLRIHRGNDRVSLRAFDAAYRKVEERGDLLLRFTAPDYLRDTAFLIVERDDGSSDAFLYQPEARRVRRVSTSQKSDAFFGSDLTLEDLEHQSWQRYEVRELPTAEERGYTCHVIEALPRHESQYGRIVAWIDRETLLLLRVDFYRSASDTPLKTLTVETEGVEMAGHLYKPRRMWVRQNGRDAATEVEFTRIDTDTVITDRVFSAIRLERSGRDLFESAGRGENGVKDHAEHP